MKNPFQYGGIVTGPYFADRSEEIKELSREMENNSRIFLVSQRRFGKTCLLHHLKSSLEKNGVACTYVDLNAYPDLRSLAGAVAGMATRALESNTDRVLKIFSGFRRLRPKLGIDGEGHLSAGLEVAVAEKEALSALMEAVAHIGELAAKKKKKTVIIIDEFSDIEKYDGGTVEKALRSEIQKQSHIAYIFSGSEESVMLDMVQDRKRAFYKLGRLMRLGPIRRESYIDFISGWLAKGGFRITTEEIVCILDIGEDVPYNIQRLCHTMWEAALEAKTIDSALVERLPVIIARQDSAHYEMLWQSATQAQKTLLIALAEDPEALPFSKEFQMKHGIGPSSSIKASFVSLIKKGIVCRSMEGQYRFVDRFMPYWIEDIRR